MMKKSLICILLTGACATAITQENKTITINSIEQGERKIKSVNKYPAFTEGQVVFKDKVVINAKLNFDRLAGQVLFIRPQGDTMALAHPEIIDKVVIGTDTFYHFEDSYIERLTHYDALPNLYTKQTLKLIGKEKKGAYGTYSAVSSSNSNSTYTYDNQVTQYISIDENAIFKPSTDFYLSDRFNNFFTFTKNRMYKVFFNHEKELGSFIDMHKTDFKKKDDLLALIDYALTLK